MTDRIVREWRVVGDDYDWPLAAGGAGQLAYSFTWPRPGSDARRKGEDPDDGETAARAFWESSVVAHAESWRAGARLEHRTVTTTGWATEEVNDVPA